MTRETKNMTTLQTGQMVNDDPSSFCFAPDYSEPYQN